MPLYILHNLWQNPNKYKSYDSILETWCKIHFGESWFFTMRLYDNYFDSFYKYKEDIHTRNEYVLSIEKCADIGLKLLDLMSSNNFDREDRQNLWQLLSDDLELYLTKHTQQSATGEIVREYLTSDLDNLVNRLLNGSKTGMETFQRYMAMDSSSITKIPKTYRNLFHDDILIPMQISANIYKWLSLICVAYNDIKENKYLESSKTLYWASNQIEACIENSANLEYDKWKDWLKGAKYFDLNKICQRTREISLKIEDLQIHQ